MPANDASFLNTRFGMDGHVDVLYEMTESHPNVSFEELHDLPVSLEKMKAANVLVMVAALYCPDTYNGEGTAARFLSGLINYAEKYLTGLKRIGSSTDLAECIEHKTQGIVRLVENADALLDIDRKKLATTGIRVAGLTHQGRNRIADGNNVHLPDGLSSAGKSLVKELAAEGFVFDIAHLALPGFRDLTRIYEGPLLSSHTGVRALCDIPRNLTREQIEVIHERKGVVGIAADPKMLSTSGEASIEDIFRHADWIAQSFDTDGLAVGTDFCGFDKINAGFEDISKLSDLANLFLKNGYPEESVRKILGRNWYDFYSGVFGR